MKVDPSKYDYVMYVDASGDDGFKFENGSSSCYCAAALLVSQADISHNLTILEQIKKIVGCKATDEVKYSKVRRHRRSQEALELLNDLKGRMSCYIVFKKELTQKEMPTGGSKELSVICHAMALHSMDYFEFATDEKVLVTIDRMKHTEEAPLEQILSKGALSTKQHPDRNFSHEVIFRDSKDANFLLLQIADLLCGIIREHFEQYEYSEDMLYFRNLCPKCLMLREIKKGHTRNLCKKGRIRADKILHSKNLHHIFRLIPVMESTSQYRFFFMRPAGMMDRHCYIFCKKI